MNRRLICLLVMTALTALVATAGSADPWPPAKAPAIPQADGYVDIPHAAVPP